jgi:hypothetical protein
LGDNQTHWIIALVPFHTGINGLAFTNDDWHFKHSRNITSSTFSGVTTNGVKEFASQANSITNLYV